jgi:hypothetical protein
MSHRKQTQFQKLQGICEGNKLAVQERVDAARAALEQERIHMEALDQEQTRALTNLQHGQMSKSTARSIIQRIITERQIVMKTSSMWLVQHSSCLRELHKVNQSVTQLDILASNNADDALLSEFKMTDFHLFSNSSHERTLAGDKRSMLFDAISTAVETTTMESDDEDDMKDAEEQYAQDNYPSEKVDDIMLAFSVKCLPMAPCTPLVAYNNYDNGNVHINTYNENVNI